MKRPLINIDETIKKERLSKYGIPIDIPLGEEWRYSTMYNSYHPLGSKWREICEFRMNLEDSLRVTNRWIWFTNLFRSSA